MKTLEAMAREIESTFDDIWDVSVYAGFAFADTPDTDSSTSPSYPRNPGGSS